MATPPTDDPILRRFKTELEAMYGARLERAILFGSRARGEAHAESDYDVAVFLRDMDDRWAEFDRLAKLHLTFLDTGVFFDAKPYLAAAYDERTPLMREIRREGVDF